MFLIFLFFFKYSVKNFDNILTGLWGVILVRHICFPAKSRETDF